MKTLNHALVAFIAVLAVISVNHAQAADDMPAAAGPTYEVTGAANANYTHVTTNAQGSHSWNVSGGMGYFFNNMYELGGNVSFNDGSQNGSETRAFSLTVGPTFNFMGAPENAFFVTLQAGVLLIGQGQAGPNFTQFEYLAGFGKRIEIVKHVTWTPEVSLVGFAKNTDQTTGDVASSQTGLVITPLQFSLLF